MILVADGWTSDFAGVCSNNCVHTGTYGVQVRRLHTGRFPKVTTKNGVVGDQAKSRVLPVFRKSHLCTLSFPLAQLLNHWYKFIGISASILLTNVDPGFHVRDIMMDRSWVAIPMYTKTNKDV